MNKYININVRKFVKKEIRNLKKIFFVIIKEQKRARKLAYKELRARLERMNEIRDQLRDQADTFATKQDLQLLEKDVKNLSRLVFIGLGILLAWKLLITTGIIKI